MKRLAITASVLLLAACGSTNSYLSNKTMTVEYYRIFDIKTAAQKKQVIAAASAGLGRNTGAAQESTPIPSGAALPEQPGRFKLINPLEGSKLAALASGAGSLGIKIASCDGAVWTAKASRQVQGSSALNLTACLFQYKDGYHLDLYAVFTKVEGGLMQISRDMASAMVGTPEQWTEKTFVDMVREINTKVDAKITLLEAQPDLEGTPWLEPANATAK